jgi:uncharacterized membrane protein
MQVTLAIIAFAAAVGAWLLSSNEIWLIGGILIVAVIPFTLVFILPINKKLFDPSLDTNSEAARQLLMRWGKLHAVRTALSTAAFVIFVLALTIMKPSGRPSPLGRESRCCGRTCLRYGT